MGSVNFVEKVPAVFFDRDGTLMAEAEYCSDPALVAVFPGVTETIQQLRAAGFAIVVITNQSGIGRGYYTIADYEAVHAEFIRQVGDGLIDATYYCPEAPGAVTSRRKPSPAMVLEAERDLGIDLARSIFVGDKAIDVQCGRSAGTATVLVKTGYGAKESGACEPDYVADSIPDAGAWILRHKRPGA